MTTNATNKSQKRCVVYHVDHYTLSSLFYGHNMDFKTYDYKQEYLAKDQ